MSLSKTKFLKRSSSFTVSARHTRCLPIAITGRIINCIHLQCPVTLYTSAIRLFLLDSVFPGGILVNLEDVYAALIAALLVVTLSLFFQKTGTGRVSVIREHLLSNISIGYKVSSLLL